jgi:hypothetical protein
MDCESIDELSSEPLDPLFLEKNDFKNPPDQNLYPKEKPNKYGDLQARFSVKSQIPYDLSLDTARSSQVLHQFNFKNKFSLYMKPSIAKHKDL